jgi:hypothetical protein
MRIFSFRIFEESDPDVIAWLDSLPKMERSAMIRRALRTFKRGDILPDRICRINGATITEKLYREGE